jgi:cell division protein FtsN
MSSDSQSSESGIPVYVWAIVGVVVVGIVISIILAVVIIVCRKKKDKPKQM